MSFDPHHRETQRDEEITASITAALSSLIKQEMQNKGSISFARYMQLSLYHPEYGYYSRGSESVGKQGDFFTSVSVGSCFGTILAHRIVAEWRDQGSPKPFHLIEIGANTGQLAKDILDALKLEFPDLYGHAQYHIVEHLSSMAEMQAMVLQPHQERIQQHLEFTCFGKHGVILSNELIDAFPAHLMQFQQGKWYERRVSLGQQGELCFTNESPTELLLHAMRQIEKTLPEPSEGYQTELRVGMECMLRHAKQALEQSLMLTIDYGYPRSLYYAASRHTGTLRCYHKHQADEDPLALPGLKDITAHVDFTQLGEMLRDVGFGLSSFSNQSRYLTQHGSSLLSSMESNGEVDQQLVRQFQTLTHPAMMGNQFYVLEACSYKEDHPEVLSSLEIEL